jgi:putative alpha-1,2-mannosidase
MSAWLVFAMLGLYPAQPFSAEYVLGQLMLHADIQLPQGRVLSIRGKGPRAQWKEALLGASVIAHEELIQGGVLRFE